MDVGSVWSQFGRTTQGFKPQADIAARDLAACEPQGQHGSRAVAHQGLPKQVLRLGILALRLIDLCHGADHHCRRHTALGQQFLVHRQRRLVIVAREQHLGQIELQIRRIGFTGHQLAVHGFGVVQASLLGQTGGLHPQHLGIVGAFSQKLIDLCLRFDAPP